MAGRDEQLGEALHALAAGSIRKRNRTLSLTAAATLATLERTRGGAVDRPCCQRGYRPAVNDHPGQSASRPRARLVDMMSEGRGDRDDSRRILLGGRSSDPRRPEAGGRPRRAPGGSRTTPTQDRAVGFALVVATAESRSTCALTAERTSTARLQYATRRQGGQLSSGHGPASVRLSGTWPA